MRYRVTHLTEYYYGEPVPLCHNVVRLRPRETWRQTCADSVLTIDPTPTVLREFLDFFSNHAVWFAIQEPHDALRIEAVSEVEVNAAPLPLDLVGPPWEQVAAALAGSAAGGDPALCHVKEYTFDTANSAAHPELAAYARPSFTKGRPIVEAMIDLTRRIYDDFEFDSTATTVGTPAIDVLKSRRGVCQDFAHLQVGCLRSLGLAGRYVSGYVLTHPPPGQKRLVGCDASHAWASAYVPGVGWIDFDPTNGLVPTGEHVTLGWGRDYDDVSPVRGVTVGGHRHSMYYGVDVEPMDEELTAGAGGEAKSPLTEGVARIPLGATTTAPRAASGTPGAG